MCWRSSQTPCVPNLTPCLIPHASYPYLFLHPCVQVSIPKVRFWIIKHLLCAIVFWTTKMPESLRCFKGVISAHQSFIISILSVSVSRTSWILILLSCFPSLKIPLLDLYMPLSLILQDSVYMVIWELLFASIQGVRVLRICMAFLFFLLLTELFVDVSFLTSCSVPDTQSAPIEWSNLSYYRLKTGCIAQRKQLDWNGGRIWRAKESRWKCVGKGITCTRHRLLIFKELGCKYFFFKLNFSFIIGMKYHYSLRVLSKTHYGNYCQCKKKKSHLVYFSFLLVGLLGFCFSSYFFPASWL